MMILRALFRGASIRLLATLIASILAITGTAKDAGEKLLHDLRTKDTCGTVSVIITLQKKDISKNMQLI